MPKHDDEKEWFNPFTESVLEKLIDAFEKRPLCPFPPEHAGSGAGVYAIYYAGDFKAYRDLVKSYGSRPIYIGKAVMPGGRKGGGIKSEIKQNFVIRRLKEHSRTVASSPSLNIEHFKCRWLLVAPEFVNAAEAFLIDHYKPIWNCSISGFGIHTPGAGRKKQARSDWDMLHPGRKFAGELPVGKSIEEIVKRIAQAIKKK